LGLFGRRKPLHEQLAEEGGLEFGAGPGSGEPPGTKLRQMLAAVFHVDSGGFLAAPPDIFGEPSPLGEVGIHGVARPRRWDTVASAESPRLSGDAVHFVALPDGTLLVDEAVPDESLGPLAEAVERAVQPPYRAEGVRRGLAVWAVAARRIEVRELDAAGDELELVENGVVLRGRRLDENLWEVEETPL
jgi:hypothetical protein